MRRAALPRFCHHPMKDKARVKISTLMYDIRMLSLLLIIPIGFSNQILVVFFWPKMKKPKRSKSATILGMVESLME